MITGALEYAPLMQPALKSDTIFQKYTVALFLNEVSLLIYNFHVLLYCSSMKPPESGTIWPRY